MANQKSEKRLREINFGAVIVASPADEAFMAGGVMLLHPETRWTVIALCGKEKKGFAEKYARALEQLGAWGQMGNFSEEKGQKLPSQFQLQNTIMSLLQSERFDVLITHSLWGEYRKSPMIKLIAKSVLALTRTGRLTVRQLWQFAYDSGGEDDKIKPAQEADICVDLTDEIHKRKYDILTKTYGLNLGSILRQESFWLLGIKPDGQKEKN